IASGSSSSSPFFFQGTVAGTVTVSAAAAALSGTSQMESVVAGPPAGLEISTAPQIVQARACSSALTLTFRDAFGNAAPVASATTVPLSSSPASGPVLSGAATCSAALAAASFPAGASSATVFFSGRTGG